MKRLKKILPWALIVLAAGIAAVIRFSPYGKHDGFNKRTVYVTVDIAAPPEEVFAYLGNSDHAHDWSVYVDHIVPLNADSFPDGAPGSRRRCFQQADEQGIRWDELITIVEPNKRRQLTIYNMHEFPMMADGLATEQIYQPMKDGKATRLTFSVFYLGEEPDMWTTFKTYLAGYKIESVFEQNMANIKRIVEQQHAARG